MKDRNVRPFETQLLSAVGHPTLAARLGEQDIQLRPRINQHRCPPIADSQHQGRFAVMRRNHRIGGKDQLGPRREKRTKVRPFRMAMTASPQTISAAATTWP